MGIPKSIENYVKVRDLNCVYCSIEFTENPYTRKDKRSWEHIVYDIKMNGIDNISLCCISCNASKGFKLLTDWLESNYCRRKNISKGVAVEVVKEAIKHPPQLNN